MTPVDIVCRACRHTYAEAVGCTFCEPAKRQILWPALSPDSEAADLHGLARQQVRMLREQLNRLERSTKDAPTGHYDPTVGAELARMSRAVANILTEARKLEEREEARVRGAGFDEMLEIYGEWIEGLPREYQAKVLDFLEARLLPPAPPEDAELVE